MCFNITEVEGVICVTIILYVSILFCCYENRDIYISENPENGNRETSIDRYHACRTRVCWKTIVNKFRGD